MILKKVLLCLLSVILLVPASSIALTIPRLPDNASVSDITYYIATTAHMYGIDPQLALYVSHQESSWNPNAIGDQGTSFGIWQIHNVKEKGLTIHQAKDIEFSTHWSMQTMVKDKSCRQWSTCPKVET